MRNFCNAKAPHIFQPKNASVFSFKMVENSMSCLVTTQAVLNNWVSSPEKADLMVVPILLFSLTVYFMAHHYKCLAILMRGYNIYSEERDNSEIIFLTSYVSIKIYVVTSQ